DQKTYGYAFLMAIVCTVLPTLLLASGIRRIGSSAAAIIGSVGPVSTIALAWWFLDEHVDVTHAIGTILVLSGVLTVSLQKSHEP
ncbi:MAG TPA: DMT family transporter, partial [Leptospiraceae bacterium]|nr:DMT family transporter [Leptospiraceae bacterium]